MFDTLYKNWARLGVGFHESFSSEGFIDLEKTIVKTCHAGREDSRLLFGMRGWLLKHHDLVNSSRLIRLVRNEKETAILGAVVDSVIEENPRSVLCSVKRYCRKLKSPEFLFRRVALSKVDTHLNMRENLAVWKKWNLISREMSDMEGAVSEKGYIFKYNPNLALRALFGPGIRAEIFSYFLRKKKGNCLEIAKEVGQSYQPVYSELMAILKIGLAKEKKEGTARIFEISPRLIRGLLKPLGSF